ncbi:MAG: 4Fe-4S dicluster domain-containing protein [Deltaproteobacteria bacterium]|nr:4Fe-4S dicluster domain-containing protein [Deltaproteobacteria bacterium]
MRDEKDAKDVKATPVAVEGEESSAISRRAALKALGAAAPGILLVACGGPKPPPPEQADGYDWSKHYWGYAVDTTKCIGCNACVRACRAENDVPEGRYRTWVERYRIDKEGQVAVDMAKDDKAFKPLNDDNIVKAFFVPKICNHCDKSVCTQVCPVGASYQTKDGVVLVDTKRCIGCGYCVQACPYSTRYIKPGHDHIADKCTLCYHRITRGMLPACVQACPRGARIFGDLRDPNSTINTILRQRRYRLLRPELGTHPKCYYIGLDLKVV